MIAGRGLGGRSGPLAGGRGRVNLSGRSDVGGRGRGRGRGMAADRAMTSRENEGGIHVDKKESAHQPNGVGSECPPSSSASTITTKKDAEPISSDRHDRGRCESKQDEDEGTKSRVSPLSWFPSFSWKSLGVSGGGTRRGESVKGVENDSKATEVIEIGSPGHVLPGAQRRLRTQTPSSGKKLDPSRISPFISRQLATPAKSITHFYRYTLLMIMM